MFNHNLRARMQTDVDFYKIKINEECDFWSISLKIHSCLPVRLKFFNDGDLINSSHMQYVVCIMSLVATWKCSHSLCCRFAVAVT